MSLVDFTCGKRACKEDLREPAKHYMQDGQMCCA